ncbi:MAG TPA: AIR synthase-related protein, partial [Bacteroidota bacterium]
GPAAAHRQRLLQSTVLELVARGLLVSAHDVSEGGLGVAVCECTFATNNTLGVKIESEGFGSGRIDFELFGEHQSRILVSSMSDNVAEILTVCAEASLPARVIGRVSGDGRINIGGLISLDREAAESAFEKGIERFLD